MKTTQIESLLDGNFPMVMQFQNLANALRSIESAGANTNAPVNEQIESAQIDNAATTIEATNTETETIVLATNTAPEEAGRGKKKRGATTWKRNTKPKIDNGPQLTCMFEFPYDYLCKLGKETANSKLDDPEKHFSYFVQAVFQNMLELGV
jgi:hypothetical protein